MDVNAPLSPLSPLGKPTSRPFGHVLDHSQPIGMWPHRRVASSLNCSGSAAIGRPERWTRLRRLRMAGEEVGISAHLWYGGLLCRFPESLVPSPGSPDLGRSVAVATTVEH